MVFLKNVSKKFIMGDSKIWALKNVKLHIRAGDFVAIVGASGCGKSTLLSILGFLDHPTSGDFIFDGRSVTNYDSTEKAWLRNSTIGFIFQDFYLMPGISVFENVVLPLVFAKVNKEERKHRVHEALDAIGLAHRITHKPHQLSGGERQRVAIARAIVNRPKLILADEPTGQLDSTTGTQIMNIIAKLNKTGQTIVLVTHDDSAARYAKKKLHMVDGGLSNEN